MEYELINIDTPDEFTLWKYIEKVEGELNIDLILKEFLVLLSQ
jgi:hypothetical protein